MHLILKTILLTYLCGVVLVYIFRHGLHKPVRKSFVIAYLVGLVLFFLPGTEKSAEEAGLDTIVIIFSVIIALAERAARLSRLEAWHNRLYWWLNRSAPTTVLLGVLWAFVFREIPVFYLLFLSVFFISAYLFAAFWLTAALHELHLKHRSFGTILICGSLGINTFLIATFFVWSLSGPITIFVLIIIALLILTFQFIFGGTRSTPTAEAVEPFQSFPLTVTEPESDDEDFISLKAALNDGGMDHDDIKLIKNLPAEDEYTKIFGIIVPGERAFTTWIRLHEYVAQTNRWPLIMGDPEEPWSDRFLMKEDSKTSVQDILDRAEQVDIDKWVADAVNSDPEQFIVPPDKKGKGFGRKYTVDDPEALEDSIGTHRVEPEALARPLPQALIGLFPVTEGWKVPAAMKWGGRSDCPAPEIHCAVLKDWGEKYGAELVGITGNVLEVIVDHTPETREEAFEVAKLHYAYNEQGWYQVFGFEDLAYHIYISQVWNFWWE
jgi:hypothetical protein